MNRIKKQVSKIVFNKRYKLLDEKIKKYSSPVSDDYILDFQLDSFNRIWNYCIKNIPFYLQWKNKYDIPDKIDSLNQLNDFPILTKDDIYENQNLIYDGLTNYYLTSTGGTSSITTYFPVSQIDAYHCYVNAYLGRYWWDIHPLDPILMLWGHHHLFGNGIEQRIKMFKRKINDQFINTKRISCYELGFDNVKYFYDDIVNFSPKCIISYASNVYMIAKYLEDQNLFYDSNKLKGIILTSETVTKTDAKIIQKYFNAPVIQEYGMAETGVIAYSSINTFNIRVLWDSFILTTHNLNELLVTTIYPKIFPLINYYTEDIVEVKKSIDDSVVNLSFIRGKSRDTVYLLLKDNTKKKVSVILFDHVLKYYPNIYSVSYEQDNNDIKIYLTSKVKLNLKAIKEFFIRKISLELKNVDYKYFIFFQIEKEYKTLAGKTLKVIR